MRLTVLAAVLLLPFAAAANPVLMQVFSEFQVTPDSLERIELFPYSGISSFPYPLGGTEITTYAGTAVIDQGVQFDHESSYVVIDSTNTTGIFSLNDAADSIVLEGPWVTGSLRYPANPWRSHMRSLAPPPGMSSAVYRWREGIYPDIYDVYTWYLDSTPTFGAPNNDNAGGVFGTVKDSDSVGLADATVTLAGPNGAFRITTWPGPPSPYGRGYYFQKPTGPGKFQMSVTHPDYLPWFMPESLELGTNELRQIDVVLHPVGVEELSAETGFWQTGWRSGRFMVQAAETGPAELSVFGSDGRRVWRGRRMLERGANALALVPRPVSGVYVVSVRSATAAVSRKVVVY